MAGEDAILRGSALTGGGSANRGRTVLTHHRCNQACTFCIARRPTDDLKLISSAAVKARIDAALTPGVEDLWLTGGEPAMRGDLEALVAHAKERGAARVGLETNGTLLDAERARRLSSAGLRLLRIQLSGWGQPFDAVTRNPGGFESAARGLEAALSAGLQVEVSAVAVRSTAATLATLPSQLRQRFASPLLRGILLVTPVDAPGSEVLSYADLAPLVLQVEAEARRVAMPMRLHPGTAPPPCVFEPACRPHALWSLSPGGRSRVGYRKVHACRGCLVDDRCSGIPKAYLARFPMPRLFAIAADSSRRRLSSTASIPEQVARELVSPNPSRLADGSLGLEHVIRINFRCNQSCRFCFVSTHLPDPDESAVRDAIAAAAAQGAKIVLSGGEPTLNPRLIEYVVYAKRLSRLPVEIQTNAIELSDARLCAALEAAGLDAIFASLHGSTASTADRVTGTVGAFEKTSAALDNIARTHVRMNLNFVLCRANLGELAPFVQLVGARWPRAFINVSFVAPSTDLVPVDTTLIPRYSDARPAIADAADEAERLGIELGGFESMCGIPLCLLPEQIGRSRPLLALPPRSEGDDFVKVEACHGCRRERMCYGLRRSYAALYGTGELRRV